MEVTDEGGKVKKNVKNSTLSLENDVYMRKKLYLCTVKRKLYGND